MLVDAELVEDRVDVGALDEALGVERVDPVGVGEDADVGVGDARVQLAQLGLRVGADLLVLDRQQPPVDVLGRRALLRAKCMSCAARTASRTAPRAQSMTSVVRTLRIPSS